MGTRQGNKLPSHVAPDHHSISDFSLDSLSLSFAGLVSIQDQQHQQQQPIPSIVPNKQDGHYHHLSNKLPEPNFEFATNKLEDINSASNPVISRITPADVLISNGQIVPQVLPSHQPKRSSFISNNTNPPRSLRTFLATDHHKSTSKMPSGKLTGKARKYYEPLGKARNNTDTVDDEKDEARKGFGQKVLRSFLSPCRDCKAIQPGAAVKCSRKSSEYK